MALAVVNGQDIITVSSGAVQGSQLGVASGVATLDGSTKVVQHSSWEGVANGVAQLDGSVLVPVAQGGTHQSTWATGDILYASGTNTLAKLPIGSTNNVLTVIGGVPSWQAPSVGSLQSAYTAGATISTSSGTGISFSNTTTDNIDLLTLNKSPSSGSHNGCALNITQGANTAQQAVAITASGSGGGILMALGGSGNGFTIQNSAGTGSNIVSQVTGTSGAVLAGSFQNSGANGADCVQISKTPSTSQAGAGLLVTMGANATDPGVRVSSTNGGGGNGAGFFADVSGSATGSCFRAIISGSTSSHGMEILQNASGGGSGIYISAASGQTGITFANNTVTANSPLISAGQTWNSGGTTFQALLVNVTSTASAVASSLIDLQLSSASVFKVQRDGTITIGGTSGAINGPSGVDFAINAASPNQGMLVNGGSSGFVALQIGGSSKVILNSSNQLRLANADLRIESGYQITMYQGVNTAGWGVPAIYDSHRATAQTGANASVATYTVGAADGSFEVSANVNVTTSTTHNFSMTVAYTDETNTAQTITLTFYQNAGAATTSTTTITNTTGAGPYYAAPVRIRCKAATSITVATTGTFTTVTYNAEADIKQVA